MTGSTCLKENIRHYLSDLLNFEVIEIRLLEHSQLVTLVPLLSVEIDQDASDRQLFAHPQGNGITGYVAASGMSYVCHDVENDPLFIPGDKYITKFPDCPPDSARSGTRHHQRRKPRTSRIH